MACRMRPPGRDEHDQGGVWNDGIGRIPVQNGFERRMECGVERDMERGIEFGIREMILDNLEEGTAKERIFEKLCRRFKLDSEKAWGYIGQYSCEPEKHKVP